MNESIKSMDKYLWSTSPVPGTAHYKREWNGAQGRQTSCTIAKVYISREEWMTSQTVILVFKKINRATDKKVIQRLYFRGKGIGMGCCWSVTQSCPTLCNPMDCSTPGLPVHYQLPEFAQTHVHWVGDAIQPSHPLLPSSPFAFNISQHRDLF